MTMGEKITQLRKEKAMTQMELARKLGVTDKAVSKWERNQCCPDVTTLPKLAEVFGISVDTLLQAGSVPQSAKDSKHLIKLICKAVSLAMGVAVVVLSAMEQLDTVSGLGMLGIGLTGVAISLFLE